MAAFFSFALGIRQVEGKVNALVMTFPYSFLKNFVKQMYGSKKLPHKISHRNAFLGFISLTYLHNNTVVNMQYYKNTRSPHYSLLSFYNIHKDNGIVVFLEIYFPKTCGVQLLFLYLHM